MAIENEFRCDRCEKAFIAHVVKTSQSKNVYVDMSKFRSRCKIPQFSYNHVGNEVVSYWDCVNQQEIIYSQKEWREKRDRGEL